MGDDLLKSAKAQITERLASPLISSFVISWCLWNYKFFVVLFSKASVSETFALVNTHVFPTTWAMWGFGLIFPLLTTAIYIFGYPYPAKFVYEFSLSRQKEANEVRQKIENETLLSIEESRRIRSDVLKSEKEHKQLVDQLNAEVSRLKQDLVDASVSGTESKRIAPQPTVPGGSRQHPLTGTQAQMIDMIRREVGMATSRNLIEVSGLEQTEVEFEIEQLRRLGLIAGNHREGWSLTHEGKGAFLKRVPVLTSLDETF